MSLQKTIALKILSAPDPFNLEYNEKVDPEIWGEVVEQIKIQTERACGAAESTKKTLERFYKEDDSVRGSIRIIFDKKLMKIFKATQSSTIKERVLSEKVKAQYIKKKGNNFVEIEKGPNGEVGITSIDYYSARKAIAKAKLAYLVEGGYMGGTANALYKIAKENKERKAEIEEAISGLRNVISTVASGSSSIRNRNYGFGLGLVQKKSREERVNWDSALIVSIANKNKTSITSAINSIFNLQELTQKNLLKTKIESFEDVNPETGFIAKKTRRIVDPKFKEEERVIAKRIKDGKDLNVFFEEITNRIKMLSAPEEEKNEETILLSGDEIVAAYNCSSYFNSGYNYSFKSEEVKGSENGIMADAILGFMRRPIDREPKGGSLFGSCMRRDQNIDQIKFYAKNPKLVKLLVRRIKETKEVKARAVVWVDSQSGVHYVDRIFFYDNNSLLQIVKYIEEKENFYSISSINAAVSSKKSLDEFVIPFNGLEYYSVNKPYFDTMWSNTFKDKDGNEYIGRISTERIYKQTENIFYEPRFEKPMENETEGVTRCQVSNTITEKGLKIGDLKVNLNAVTILRFKENCSYAYTDKARLQGDYSLKKILGDREIQPGVYYRLKRQGWQKSAEMIEESELIKADRGIVVGLNDPRDAQKYLVTERKSELKIEPQGWGCEKVIKRNNHIQMRIMRGAGNYLLTTSNSFIEKFGLDSLSVVTASRIEDKFFKVSISKMTKEMISSAPSVSETWDYERITRFIKNIIKNKGEIEADSIEIDEDGNILIYQKCNGLAIKAKKEVVLGISGSKSLDEKMLETLSEEIKNGYTAIKEAS